MITVAKKLLELVAGVGFLVALVAFGLWTWALPGVWLPGFLLIGAVLIVGLLGVEARRVGRRWLR